MKNFILSISVVLSVMISNAQDNSVYPNGENVRKASTQAWGILFSYGAINFNGDIKQYDFGTATQEIGDFDELRYAYNVGVRRTLDEGVVGCLFQRRNGWIKKMYRWGSRRWYCTFWDEIYDPYNNFDGNGEKFMNQFIEFNASYLYPLKELNTYFTDFDVSVKAGLGMNIFTSQKQDLFTDEHIYSYGYDDDVNGDDKILGQMHQEHRPYLLA